MSSTVVNQKPQVEYVRLGRSGLRVSVPIIGAMSFGDKRWSVSDANIAILF